MKRLLVLFGVAVAALVLAFLRPAAPPAITAGTDSVPVRHRARDRAAPSFMPPPAVVYVVGAVLRPGLYRLAESSRIDDAVRAAGGLTGDADPASVDLAEKIEDGEEIHVLRAGERAAVRTRSRAPRTPRSRKAKHARRASVGIVDVNAADADELASLPGIGPALAQRIVEYRRVNGHFASTDELADVAGMTQRRLDALAPYLRTISQ